MSGGGGLSAHTHAEADVAALVADLAGKAPAVHGHAEADVAGLVADLAGKQTTITTVDVPYNAGDFSQDAGTWTVDAGDLKEFSYTLIGKEALLNLTIEDSTIAGVVTVLRVTYPAATVPIIDRVLICIAFESGVGVVCNILSLPGTPYLVIFKVSGIPFAVGVNTLNLNVNIRTRRA